MPSEPPVISPGPTDLIKLLMIGLCYLILNKHEESCEMVFWLSVLWKIFLADVLIKFTSVACLTQLGELMYGVNLLVYFIEIVWHLYGLLILYLYAGICHSDVELLTKVSLGMFLISVLAAIIVWCTTAPVSEKKPN